MMEVGFIIFSTFFMVEGFYNRMSKRNTSFERPNRLSAP